MGVKDMHGGWYKGHDVQIQSGQVGKRCWARVARIYRETQDQHWGQVKGWPQTSVWAATELEAAQATFELAKTWIDKEEHSRR